MNNITEIVYGDSLCHWLKQCDFISNNKIIKFDKFFSIADLSNINNNKIMIVKDNERLLRRTIKIVEE